MVRKLWCEAFRRHAYKDVAKAIASDEGPERMHLKVYAIGYIWKCHINKFPKRMIKEIYFKEIQRNAWKLTK